VAFDSSIHILPRHDDYLMLFGGEKRGVDFILGKKKEARMRVLESVKSNYIENNHETVDNMPCSTVSVFISFITAQTHRKYTHKKVAQLPIYLCIWT
jgi:hypothetical protein